MFPRIEGHCFTHHVPGPIDPRDYDPTEYCADYDSEDSCDEFFETSDPLDAALKYLRKRNADLRRGDLIVFDVFSKATPKNRNNGIAIFDGTKIMLLSYNLDKYGSLPQEFRVIEDKVPLNYWKDVDDTKRGIGHNSIVWFNHIPVRDQCLKNLRYGEIENGIYAIVTTFTYHDQGRHRIIFDYTDIYNGALFTHEIPQFMADSWLKCFAKHFEKDDLIVFTTECSGYQSDERTLFIRAAAY